MWQVATHTVLRVQETTNEIELARTRSEVATVDRGHHVYVAVSKLLLEKYCIASERYREATFIIPTLSPLSRIYYTNTRILCVCVCVCVCVRVSVISEISGTGGRSATLLAPTRRASPGELQQLHLESTQRI